MSTTAIFLVGLFAANLCLAFIVITAIELRASRAEAQLDRDLAALKAAQAGPDAELFGDSDPSLGAVRSANTSERLQ